jgi:transposase
MIPYASDLSDAEWAILEPSIPEASPGGRPQSVNMRRITLPSFIWPALN